MTLRQKTLLIIGVTLVSLIGVLYSTSSTILLGGFSKVEQQATRKNVERVQEALSDELSQLKVTTQDWAKWDQTYAFIENGNQEYIKTYLNDVSIASSLKLNLMLYIHSSGRIVYGKDFDLVHEKSTPISKNFKKYLSTKGLLRSSNNRSSSLKGLILVPEGPILIAARPILNSDGSGSIRGTLIMGRYLNAALIEQLGKRTRLSITMYPVGATSIPSDFRAVRSSLLKRETTLVRPLNNQTVAGYTIIKDIYGQPALMIRVDTARNVYQQGQVSIYYLGLSLLMVGLVFSGATLLLLEQLILSRMSRLSSNVRNIGNSGDLSARVLSITGKDELSSLAKTINGMLEALENSQNKQREGEERYYKYSRVLAELTKRQTLQHGDLNARFREITEVAACTLEVERASVWLYDAQHAKMQCVDLYQHTTGQHSAGIELLATDYPAYYQALQQERTIATDDVSSDPKTKKLLECYLSQFGIASILAAPICLNGQIVGAIGLAHVGASRQWLLEEHNFVGSLADLVSLLMEGFERKRSQEELQQIYEELEKRIRERTGELAKANEKLQAEIIERYLSEEKLLHEALHDPLTGLPNRALFMQRLESAIERSKREKYSLAVLFLDLDGFKVINDSLGHLVGDQLLVAIAQRLQACLRPGDLVARLGGDEFTILLENLKDVSDATNVAERIQHELALPFNLNEHKVLTAASIGIALSNAGDERPESLLHDADVTMYRAKALGKSRYEVFERTTQTQVVSLLHLQHDLQRMLKRQ